MKHSSSELMFNTSSNAVESYKESDLEDGLGREAVSDEVGGWSVMLPLR